MSRTIEILLVLLLLVFGAGVMAQYQNQKLLNAILERLKEQDTVAVNRPAVSLPEGAQPANPNSTPTTPVKPVVVIPATPTTPNDPKPVEPKPTPTEPATPPEPVAPKPPVEPTTPTTPEVAVDEGDPKWQSSGPLVESVIRQLLAGEYETVRSKMDPVMQTNMSREAMAAAIDPIRKEHGAFSKIVKHKSITEHVPPGMSTFAIDTAFEDGYQLRFTITIDSKQRISGLIADSVE